MLAVRFLRLFSLHISVARASLFLVLSGVFGSAWAAGLQASPINVSMAEKSRAAVVTLSNTGKIPMNAQVRIFAWSQSDKDEYELAPTGDLLVSPPILQLAAGASQEIRIIRTGPAGQGEQYYRLIVDELPSPTATPKKGMNLLIRHNIPVFLNAEGYPTAQLQWQAQAAGAGTRVRISNIGKTRAQIGRIWLEQGGKEIAQISDGLTGYALPNFTLVREFKQPLSRLQAAGVQLKAQINGSAVSVALNP